MSNTGQRIVVGFVMATIAALAAFAEYHGISAVRYLGLIIVFAMIAEYVLCLLRTPSASLRQNWLSFSYFMLLLMIICSADIGAWFFGRMIGGDKMWERLSSGKTWSGQIAGILCGTFAGVMYGLLGADTFMPQLLWIGISVSLLSQYGDLTASWIKRKLGIKDFGTILPGHGGILDRFDGWIYVLPLVWLVML